MSIKGCRKKILRVTDAEKEACRETIEKLAQIGCTNDEISRIVNFEEKELENHFQKVLSKGRAMLRGNLRKAQMRSAIEDRNTAMLIWLGKQFLGQYEPRNVNNDNSEYVVEKVDYGKAEKTA